MSLLRYLVFQARFGAELFTAEDDRMLLQTVMGGLNNLSLGAGHRLLMYQWAMHLPQVCKLQH